MGVLKQLQRLTKVQTFMILLGVVIGCAYTYSYSTFTATVTSQETELLKLDVDDSVTREVKETDLPLVSTISHEAFSSDITDEELKLVRTSTKPYGAIDRTSDERKYFMYSPSGGFNNQRKELEYALKISKILDRGLLVPMAARHTSRWNRYHELGLNDMVAMDLILDFQVMEQFGVELVPLNQTIAQMEEQFDQEGILELKQQKYRMQWKGEKEIKAKLDSDAKMLFLKGPTMYHPWFEAAEMVVARHHIVYTKFFRRIAIEMIKLIGDADFGAVHFRMGDYARRGRLPNPDSFIKDLLNKGFSKKHPLYIATEPNRKQKFFGKFDRAFKTSYANNFGKLTSRYERVFPPSCRVDFIGVVEQLVCVGGRKFVGTRYSTFSEGIYKMRKSKVVHFPELPALRAHFNGEDSAKLNFFLENSDEDEDDGA